MARCENSIAVATAKSGMNRPWHSGQSRPQPSADPVVVTVEGELTTAGDVWIEEKSTVKANVEGRNVNVRGDLESDLVLKDRLLLAGSGSVQGNVRVRRLAIEDGATLNGNVNMSKGEG